MDVSVIIPLYNGERWIEKTLASVLAQTHRPHEVLVVDDGSTDDSREVVHASFPEVELIRRQEEGGKGAGGPRRFGLARTTAPFVAFLDQDDLWHPEHLSTLVPLLEEHTDCSAAVAGLRRFEAPAVPAYDLHPDGTEVFSLWDRFPRNVIHSPSGVLVRRRALDEIGGWPADFAISDLHAWLKLTALAPMVRTASVTVAKRVHHTSALESLRADKAIFYIKEHLRLCADALAFREQVAPGGDAFRRRLELFQAIEGVFEGALTGDEHLLAASARAAMQQEGVMPEQEKALWDYAYWMLGSQVGGAEVHAQSLFLERLVRHWPSSRCGRSCLLLAEVLTWTLSYKSFLQCALRQPLRALASPLFRTCAKMQAGKAWARVTRPAE